MDSYKLIGFHTSWLNKCGKFETDDENTASLRFCKLQKQPTCKIRIEFDFTFFPEAKCTRFANAVNKER